MKISRDNECNGPRVVRGSSEDRQGHSLRTGLFHGEVYDAPQHTSKKKRAYADGSSSCLDESSHGWVPVNTPLYFRADFGQEAVGSSTSRPLPRSASHRRHDVTARVRGTQTHFQFLSRTPNGVLALHVIPIDVLNCPLQQLNVFFF